jgi:perosamine synthetase
MIPYGRHAIDDDDIAAVAAVLRSDWLTTGPAVTAFETAVADYLAVPHAVAVNTGTAALHAAMAVLDIGPGDEVIVPCLTFVATANAAVFQGARPVFADIDPDTLLIDPADVARRITPRTRAIVAVDYAGQPADWKALRTIADARGIPLVADGCHALGASRDGVAVGRLADLTALSFHPVKHITTAEGGMLIAHDPAHDRKARAFRSHGIDTDWRERAEKGTFSYAMTSLGWNYRLPDLNCALGTSQMKKLDGWLARRRRIAAVYDRAFAGANAFTPLSVEAGVQHAWHLYVIRLDAAWGAAGRAELHARLRARGIGANVHYPVVHLHPFYRERFGTGPGLCPAGEQTADLILTLPLHQGMTDADVAQVIDAVLAETRARAA